MNEQMHKYFDESAHAHFVNQKLGVAKKEKMASKPGKFLKMYTINLHLLKLFNGWKHLNQLLQDVLPA